MALYSVALALAVFSVCYVVFLKRAIDEAPEYAEPDIDRIIQTIEEEEHRASEPPKRRDGQDRRLRFAQRRAA